VTTNDTIYNKGTLNWTLADGKAGFLDGYQNVTNVGRDAKMQLTVGEYAAYPTNVVIATGDFSNIAAAKTDTFSLTNVLGGAALTGLKIDGAEVADELMSYQLATEEDAESGTTNLVLKVVLLTTCEREEIRAGDTKKLEEGFTYKAAPTEDNGGAFNLKGGAALTGADVAFESNAAAIGGAIYSDGGTVALTNATFTGNKSAQGGGAIYSNGGTVALTNATFTGNTAATYGGAILNSGTLTLDDVSFEGNEAAQGGGAICNIGGTANFDGAITLKTESDTIFNTGTLNWNLAGGKQGVLNGYDKLTNSGGKLRLTIEDYATMPTNFVIATGEFSDVKNKNTFSITNVLGGAAIAGLQIGRGAVTTEDGLTGYQLVTEEDLSVPTTNLVLKIATYTYKREEVTGTKTLEEDFIYTAAPTDEDGGAFCLKTGATLTGTNVTFAGNGAMHGGAIGMDGGRLSLEGGTFESNKVEKLGGAIYNYGGNAALKGTAFTGNKSVQDGGSIYNNGTLSLDGVTFEGNEAGDHGGAIANSES